MVLAASAAERSRELLRRTLKVLGQHPDYTKTERARRRGSNAMSLAWWLRNCISSTLADAPLGESADWLMADAVRSQAVATMRRFVKTERRDMLAQQRRDATVAAA